MRDSTGRLSLWMLAVASTLVVCGPLLTDAWIGGHEGANYLFRAAEFGGQLREGEPWPRWAPDFYWGYGYPFFVFYPPGLFYLAALASSVLGVAGGLELTVAIGCLLMFFGMRHLLRPGVSEGAARFGATVATVLQWRFVQVYVRGDLAEALATSLLPWLFAAVLRDRPLRVALILGVVCYLHTLTALMACWCLAILGVAAVVRAKRGWRFVRLAGAGTLGLVMGAGYLLPAALERPLVRTELMTARVEGVFSFHYSDHFVAIWQRFTPVYRWGVSTEGTADTMPFGDPPLAWIIVGVALGLAAWRSSARRQLLPWLLAWIAVGAMVVPLSRPAWAVMPMSEFFQFPWRWLLLEGIVLGGLGAVAVDRLDLLRLPRGLWLGLGAMVAAGAILQGVAANLDGSGLAIVTLTLLLAVGAALLPSDARGPVRAAAVLAVIAALPLTLATFTKASISPTPLSEGIRDALEDPRQIQLLDLVDATGHRLPIATAGVNEYLPRTVQSPPRARPGTDLGARPDYDLGPPAEQSGAWRRWYLDSDAAGLREAAWFFYPGVKASVDGVEVPVQHDEHGLVQLQVPAGPHVVDVWYGQSRPQRLAVRVAAAGWLLWGGLVLARRRRAARAGADTEERYG